MWSGNGPTPPDAIQISAKVYGWTTIIGSSGPEIIDAEDNVYIIFNSDPSVTVAGLNRIEPNATIAKVQFTHTVAGSTILRHTLNASST